MRYKSGDLCVIHSKTSSHNGKVVEVVDYTKGKCKDILLVKIRSHNDIIRNLSDKQLKRLLN